MRYEVAYAWQGCKDRCTCKCVTIASLASGRRRALGAACALAALFGAASALAPAFWW